MFARSLFLVLYESGYLTANQQAHLKRTSGYQVTLLYGLLPRPSSAYLLSLRYYAGRKWFDCAECHQEKEDHALLQSFEMTFACKKCKKCFRKDAREFEER